ncbi:MAG: DNA-processing protein DprA [bacterium]
MEPTEKILPREDALRIAHALQYVNPDAARTAVAMGSLDALLACPEQELLALEGLGPVTVTKLRRARGMEVDRIEEDLQRRGIIALVRGHPGYPFLLGQAAPGAAPLVLYVKGHPGALSVDGVAIVGTRRPSPFGQRFAAALGRDVARQEMAVVSGLAYGIDAAAHRGCLEGEGTTVGVLAHGLHTVQPGRNRALARRILESGGALVSEYPPGVAASKKTFVPRNRIIAWLTAATVVVEGRETSGARHTAEYAMEADRTVLAVPGRPDDPLAGLPNRLLREDGAAVCRHSADLLATVDPRFARGVERALRARAMLLKQRALEALEVLGPDAHSIMGRLDGDPHHVDELARWTRLPVQRVLELLLHMELEGLVEQIPGMRYIANLDTSDLSMQRGGYPRKRGEG